jgi:hypothetical protein
LAQIVEVLGVGNVEFPDGMSKEQIGVALQNMPMPKSVEEKKGTPIYGDVPTVAGAKPNIVRYEKQPEPKPVTMMDRVKAIYEVPTAIVSGAAAPFLGVGAGIAENIMQGTNKRVDSPEFAQKFQYQPTSPVSQDILQTMGSAMEAAKIPPYLGNIGAIPSAIQKAPNVRPVVQESVIPMANRTANQMATALRNEGQMIQEAVQPVTNRVAQAVAPVTNKVNDMADALRAKVTVEGAPTMTGVGAAEVPEARTRYQTAQQLRVPVSLSKGEATKDFAQQAFETETAKSLPDTTGKPLLLAKAERNDAILKNFDAYVDATNKEFFNLRKVGKVVDDVLTKNYDKDANLVRQAYEKARAEGAMQEPIDYSMLKAHIEKQAPTVRSKLSPILNVVDEEIARNDPTNTGRMPINALEDIYRVINENYDFNAPKHFIEMKQIINQMTENKGGEAYTVAKKLRQQLANKYENSSYVDKLLNTKKGYNKDRIVALEDVFKHSILDGSLDDVKAIGYVLKTSGDDGAKALNELKGQTIQYIKDEVTKSTKNDIKGNPVVSSARFKSIVKELDDDGKLDYLFGKKGAQEIRDLLETTLNVNTTVEGAANYSNSSSAIIRGLDLLGKFPVPKLLGAKTAAELIKTKELKKQVKESIDYTPEGMAKELRKGK